MNFDGAVMNIRQFESSDHPYWLPRFMDVFTWSIPFVAEKIANVMHRILEIIGDEEDDELDKIEHRSKNLRAKILSIGKWQAQLSAMRRANEDLLHTGADGFIELPAAVAKEQFETVRERDRNNERWQPGSSPPTSPSRRLSDSLGPDEFPPVVTPVDISSSEPATSSNE
jgi:serine/threonine-protein phosphatase 2B catalytic subunit